MSIDLPRRKDLLELYGHYVGDRSDVASLDRAGQRCPILGSVCTKTVRVAENGVTVGTIPLGTCAAHEIRPQRGVALCPVRMTGTYELFTFVAKDAFGLKDPKILNLSQFAATPQDGVVVLGRGSGTEIKITNADLTKMSFDWILANVSSNQVISIAALEVQAVDITGNYREALNAHLAGTDSPGADHGYNQANVYKRLISQLIPKGKAISNSHLAKGGLYFAVPGKFVPYFSAKLGNILTKEAQSGPDQLSVIGVDIDLSSYIPGQVMKLAFSDPIRANIDAVAAMTMRGVGSQGPAIDQAVKRLLNL